MSSQEPLPPAKAEIESHQALRVHTDHTYRPLGTDKLIKSSNIYPSAFKAWGPTERPRPSHLLLFTAHQTKILIIEQWWVTKPIAVTFALKGTSGS